MSPPSLLVSVHKSCVWKQILKVCHNYHSILFEWIHYFSYKILRNNHFLQYILEQISRDDGSYLRTVVIR